jgi:hypothetical protein
VLRSWEKEKEANEEINKKKDEKEKKKKKEEEDDDDDLDSVVNKAPRNPDNPGFISSQWERSSCMPYLIYLAGNIYNLKKEDEGIREAMESWEEEEDNNNNGNVRMNSNDNNNINNDNNNINDNNNESGIFVGKKAERKKRWDSFWNKRAYPGILFDKGTNEEDESKRKETEKMKYEVTRKNARKKIEELFVEEFSTFGNYLYGLFKSD